MRTQPTHDLKHWCWADSISILLLIILAAQLLLSSRRNSATYDEQYHIANGLNFLRTGDPGTSVTAVYGPLTRLDCGTYQAYQLPRGGAVTACYVFGEKIWGFGLSRRSVPVCR